MSCPRRAHRLVVAALAVLVLLTLPQLSCRPLINGSPSVRWWLFAHFGASQLCPKLLERGVGLRLTPGGNVVGRFFPDHCEQQLDEARHLVRLTFGGTGYAWTPIAGRIGFAVDTAVDYAMDFQLADDAVYVWGRTTQLPMAPVFRVGSIENKVVDWANRTPAGYLTSAFGSQLAQGQLASGFTVVRGDHGDEFSLGILSPPARPVRTFAPSGANRIVLLDERIEVHPQQLDFLGPFEITKAGQALYLRLHNAGGPVDLLAYPLGDADRWRSALQLGAPPGPPPGWPLAASVILPGEQQLRLPLPPGRYSLVVEHGTRAGVAMPAFNVLQGLGAGSAVLGVLVELGDANSM